MTSKNYFSDIVKVLPQKGVVVLQGVPTSLGYAKCIVLKLRKVCEQSELRLKNIDPIKRVKISPYLSGQNSKFTPFY